MTYLFLVLASSGVFVAIAVLVAWLSPPPNDSAFPACSDDPFTQLQKLGASRFGYYRDPDGRWWKRSAVFNPEAGQWFKLEEKV
jgi:hypothetical protein